MRRARALVVVGNGEGGGTQIAVTAMRALDPARYHVTLVAPQNDALTSACAAMGADYAPLPLLDSRIGRSVIAHLGALIDREQFDIIHAHGTRAAWFVSRCLPSHGGPPLIYSEHLFSFEMRRGPMRLPWRRLERYLCRRADRVTTTCERNARFAQASQRNPIVIRHYGIDAAEMQRQARQAYDTDTRFLSLPPDALLVGSLGRLTPQKGLRYLIEAAPRILQAAPSTHFVIAGDGVERAALEAQCRAMRLTERFHFVGALARPWTLLARCDAIALPSLWEGLPLALLEALAAGMPVVSSDVGGASETLTPLLSEGLIRCRDVGALASAIHRLLTDAELRGRFHHYGPQIAARYDIHETQRAFVALYDDIVGAELALSHQADNMGATWIR